MKPKAAAVCVRTVGGEVQFLLVRTSGGRRWTFPKGSVEDGERPEAAAAREAREEAGVSGAVDAAPLGTYRYPAGAEAEHEVSAFLLRVAAEGGAHEEGREPSWFTAQQARRKLAKRREQKAAEEHARILAAALERISKKVI